MKSSTRECRKLKSGARIGLLGGAVLFWMFVWGLEGRYLYLKNADFVRLMEEVQDREYSSEYQCLDFSRDLSRKLSDKGIPNSIAIVQQEGEASYHAVVSVQVEPQNSRLADYPIVDLCSQDQDRIVCQNGVLLGRNVYVADRKD